MHENSCSSVKREISFKWFINKIFATLAQIASPTNILTSNNFKRVWFYIKSENINWRRESSSMCILHFCVFLIHKCMFYVFHVWLLFENIILIPYHTSPKQSAIPWARKVRGLKRWAWHKMFCQAIIFLKFFRINNIYLSILPKTHTFYPWSCVWFFHILYDWFPVYCQYFLLKWMCQFTIFTNFLL